MCPDLFLVHYLLLCLHHPWDQQYARGSGRRQTYVFCLPPLTLLLLLVVAMVYTCFASVTIIFRSATISFGIVALDPLIVALAWVSSAKAFILLAVAVARYTNASDV